MSISGTNITVYGNGGTNVDIVSGAFTPNVNRLYLLTVFQYTSATFPFTPSISTTNGLTFTLIQSELAGGVSDLQVAVYRAMITSGAVNGTVTISSGGSLYDAFFASIDEFDGVDTSGSSGSGAIVQNAVANSAGTNTITVTLAAFGSGSNGTFVAGGWKNDGAFTITNTAASAGFTELVDFPLSLRYNLDTNWRADNSVNSSVTQTDAGGIGSKGALIALELKVSGGGGGGGGAGQPNSMLQFGIGA